ncbi:hypothetical protein HDV00_007104 [Rhizophlyctis rosea]|nr:hypothetical protein HDV00_007104 [Rhizophlyctis rosea]
MPKAVLTTLVAGQKLCFRTREFVPHDGNIGISLSTSTVQPGGDQRDFKYLLFDGNVYNGTTGIHSIPITLPPNITCDSCTIQARQWAPEFKWYYYSCSDVRIVAQGSAEANALTAADTCSDRLDRCGTEWFEPAAPLVEDMIFQQGIAGIGFCLLLFIPLLIVAINALLRCCRHPRADPTTNPRAKIMVLEVEQGSSASQRGWTKFKASYWRLRYFLIPVQVLAVLWIVAAFTGLLLIKTCAVDPIGMSR